MFFEYVLNINTLGYRDDLFKYKEKLSKYFSQKITKLSEESKKRIYSNPLRILDSKQENDISISQKSIYYYKIYGNFDFFVRKKIVVFHSFYFFKGIYC